MIGTTRNSSSAIATADATFETAKEFVTKDSAGDRALQRDLSLTWAAELPAGNVVTAGNWWPQQPPDDIPGVSVEGKVARIAVRFDADIAAVTRDQDGNVVAGSLTDGRLVRKRLQDDPIVGREYVRIVPEDEDDTDDLSMRRKGESCSI